MRHKSTQNTHTSAHPSIQHIQTKEGPKESSPMQQQQPTAIRGDCRYGQLYYTNTTDGKFPSSLRTDNSGIFIAFNYCIATSTLGGKLLQIGGRRRFHKSIDFHPTDSRRAKINWRLPHNARITYGICE